MKECIFCKIINGELPSYKIFEDEHTLAFLDIGNEADGHTIVIPKTHLTNILDCDEEMVGHVMNAVKSISNHYADHCGYSGVNLLNASGTSAQQSVPHFHFHIIPRKDDDGIHAWPDLKEREKSLEDMYSLLKIQ
ncbi:HIT family protein [Lacrimispora sp.]|uniref:HIT family protein n=1 Tax=Lacrimispora sp. TaxID=2719234 RepID=UPI00289E238B|nr:HIT family protein [Lacrimispora sp.]